MDTPQLAAGSFICALDLTKKIINTELAGLKALAKAERVELATLKGITAPKQYISYVENLAKSGKIATQADVIRHLEQIEAPYITAWKEAITKIQSRVGHTIKDTSNSIGTAVGTVEQKVANEVIRAKITEQIAREIWSKSADHQKLEQIVADLNKTTSKIKVGEFYKNLTIQRIEKIEDSLPSLYEQVRLNNTDAANIAKNTGIPEQIINRIRNHVFFEEHILEKGIQRFAPDIDQLKAWQRLSDGRYYQSDLVWLVHEHAEALLMNGKMIDYNTAHGIVNNIYNWKQSFM